MPCPDDDVGGAAPYGTSEMVEDGLGECDGGRKSGRSEPEKEKERSPYAEAAFGCVG